MCELAAKLTHEEQSMCAEDLDALRRHGFGEQAIHDAVQVISLFNYYVRIADGLGVEPEDFFEPWGER